MFLNIKKIVNEIINGQVPIYVIPNSVDTEIFSFNMKTNYPLKICTLINLTPLKRVFDLIINNPEIEINIGRIGTEFNKFLRTQLDSLIPNLHFIVLLNYLNFIISMIFIF